VDFCSPFTKQTGTMAKPRLLVVEDETKVAQFIKKGLETQGYTVEVAADGREAKRAITGGAFDLYILDVNLPFVSGLELAQFVRTKTMQVPILMLTALDTTADKLFGFESGADDYLVKPFDFLELVARIKALLRRADLGRDTEMALTVADLTLDLRERVARRMGKIVELTPREFALLHYFMRNAGRVLSRMDISENVWDINFDTGTNVIDVYVNYLRNKIDKNAPVKLIHTVVGMGYMLKEK
jgi:two-component system, OmpR family, copper resistance phosphate regulon response regulator CusR